ncbi:serine/threonine-protein kinase-like protein CCR4 [Ananas comosus]|uniref:Serine/threonine-protein kinase-like protein CCR4 n=1 Tax=Ananas comosus TaxID=4615 RepID=A0A6P5EXZ4_ANACO|nr:serine/threonine-protein kinase-like protein CCR4 [Ananas comosus]
MRWWSFSGPDRGTTGKRVYRGPPLRALSAGDSHVCGIVLGAPACWRWPDLRVPPRLSFTHVAVGTDFLCGILRADASIRCFGTDFAVVANAPPGRFGALAAGARHACAVALRPGRLACWGAGAPPDLPDDDDDDDDPPADIAALALGDDRTCALAESGAVRCWGGVLLANYSAVCWGGLFGPGGRVVFDRVAPGPCAPQRACACGVLAGSGDLCGGGGDAICRPCRIAEGSASPGGGGLSGERRKHAAFAIAGFVGIGAAAAALVGAAAYGAFFGTCDRRVHDAARTGERRRRRSRGDRLEAEPAGKGEYGCEEFEIEALERATEGFAAARRIGAGSFGAVYRAALPDGREVAVKRAEDGGSTSAAAAAAGPPPPPPRRSRSRSRWGESERAFRAELGLLARLSHRNVARLLGYSRGRGERVLVFEYMPNGSLHDHLHGAAASPPSPIYSSWAARLRTALGAARGLEYLHSYAVPAVVHRDVKSSNILLDTDWTAKISDFGLSVPMIGGVASAAAGTVGYMDPEYYRMQRLTERSDVYSFGVVLLELITGRKAIHRECGGGGGGGGEEVETTMGSPRNVVEMAVPAIEAGGGEVVAGRVGPPSPNGAERVRDEFGRKRSSRAGAECVRARAAGATMTVSGCGARACRACARPRRRLGREKSRRWRRMRDQSSSDISLRTCKQFLCA